MRRPAADYLEADRIEELAVELAHQGYSVAKAAQVGDQQFDLVAQRNGELLAIEVKARSRLKESSDQLARLRTAAREGGATGFQLEVVNPPQDVKVAVEGLDAALTEHFAEELPPEVDNISFQTRFKRIKLYEIESIDVQRSGIRVQGRAALDVELNYRGMTDRIALTTDERLSFSFDVELGSDLKLARVNEIKVDVSDFADGDE